RPAHAPRNARRAGRLCGGGHSAPGGGRGSARSAGRRVPAVAVVGGLVPGILGLGLGRAPIGWRSIIGLAETSAGASWTPRLPWYRPTCTSTDTSPLRNTRYWRSPTA